VSKPRGKNTSWRARQEKDPYVRQARKEGWRSRAVFKLSEILSREKILRPGIVCVDLGAAPGGWSQYVTETLDGNVRIYALDLLPMDALPSVEFIRGDFTDDEVLAELNGLLGGRKADLVMSDMAPNISGLKAVDQPRSIYLAELALDLARSALAPGGSFICKLFQGQGTDELVAAARRSFGQVKVLKPRASRASSSEIYLVARNYHL